MPLQAVMNGLDTSGGVFSLFSFLFLLIGLVNTAHCLMNA